MPKFNSLVDCIKKLPPPTEKNKRPYRVKIDRKTFYVISNSPGNAAMEVCEVEAVTQKEQLEAFRAMSATTLPLTDEEVDSE